MSLTLKIETPRKFTPLLEPARYKAVYGGRGSGKSHFFAELMIEYCMMHSGTRAVCIREVQKSLKDSAYLILKDKLEKFGLGESDGFRVLNDRIETPGGGIIIFQGMQDHTAESIKSLEGFTVAWVEEAQTLSALSLQLLRPTIRAEGSEIWFSWNPRRRTDPVDELFRKGEPPTNSVIVEANWDDNPWFPDVLEMERLDCEQKQPDQYDNVWNGDYISVVDGAYYAAHIKQAKKEGRICSIERDELMVTHLYADIGGTGAKSDAFVIWAVQFIGSKIFVVDYYEVVGQPLSAHLAWCHERGYKPGYAKFILPHDGKNNDKVFSVSYESALREAGYDVEVVPNQGRGAAKMRIEATRRWFSRFHFDADKCRHGLEALGWYHEKRDDIRNCGLGPNHDWSSHAADAIGLMSSTYKDPNTRKQRGQIKAPKINIA